MRSSRPLPFQGRVVWLTAEQRGRAAGPPNTPADDDYAATAFVPPESITTGLASFVLRVEDRFAWSSAAEGGWLVVENARPHMVESGAVVIVTEGPKPVAYFHVERVDPPEER